MTHCGVVAKNNGKGQLVCPACNEVLQSTPEPIRLRLKHSLWPRTGDATLLGMYAEKVYADHRGDNSLDHSRVVLEFEQTSYWYRKNNGGPAEMIVPEFVPLCVVKDILSFQKQNIDVSVEIVEINNDPEE